MLYCLGFIIGCRCLYSWSFQAHVHRIQGLHVALYRLHACMYSMPPPLQELSFLRRSYILQTRVLSLHSSTSRTLDVQIFLILCKSYSTSWLLQVETWSQTDISRLQWHKCSLLTHKTTRCRMQLYKYYFSLPEHDYIIVNSVSFGLNTSKSIFERVFLII